MHSHAIAIICNVSTTLTLDSAHLDAEHVPEQTSLKASRRTNNYRTTLRTVMPAAADTWTLRYTYSVSITVIVSATTSGSWCLSNSIIGLLRRDNQTYFVYISRTC